MIEIIIIIFLLLLYIFVGIMSYIPSKVRDVAIPTYPPLKVAIQVSGPVRGSVETLYHFIIEPLNADIFVNSPNFPEDRRIKLSINSVDEESNMKLMFKRMKDLEAAYDYSIYDVVIRARPDIIFHDYISRDVIVSAAKGYMMMYPKNCLKHSLSHKGLSYTDTFFLSSPSSMRLISTIYDSITDPHRLGEDVLTEFLWASRLEVKVVYGYEILLDSHKLDKLNLLKFLYRKVTNHMPW